jgi:putative membrane protein
MILKVLPIGRHGRQPPPGRNACHDDQVRSVLVRLVVNAVALWVAAAIVHGVDLLNKGFWNKALTLLAVAAVFGIVNTIVRPIVKLFSLPLYILTLGLVIFLINALMLWITGALSHGLGLAFSVHGFWASVFGAVIVSIVSWALNAVLPDEDKKK